MITLDPELFLPAPETPEEADHIAEIIFKVANCRTSAAPPAWINAIDMFINNYI